MGRRSWDDEKLPKPLPNRTVYVATNRAIVHATAITGNLSDCILELEQAHPDKIIWVVGGADLLEQCDNIFDRLYLTHFRGSYKVDTKLNLKKFLTGWNPVRATATPNSPCTFTVYENIFKRTGRGTA
jgi:dihydrofolate reductase